MQLARLIIHFERMGNMSADNWGICPRCQKKEEKRRERLEKKIEEAYGTLPREQYLALVKEAEAPQPEVKRTLREDYELGTEEDGEFYVTYRCSCNVCGYAAKFEHKEVLTPV
jgi:hypothetical protein